MWRATNVFNANGKIYGGKRDRREIKLETSNISPLGAVVILRAISIRDVVIENERVVLPLSCALDMRENIFLHPFFFPSSTIHLVGVARARALKIKAAIIEFPFPRRVDYFCHIAPNGLI